MQDRTWERDGIIYILIREGLAEKGTLEQGLTGGEKSWLTSGSPGSGRRNSPGEHPGASVDWKGEPGTQGQRVKGVRSGSRRVPIKCTVQNGDTSERGYQT